MRILPSRKATGTGRFHPRRALNQGHHEGSRNPRLSGASSYPKVHRYLTRYRWTPTTRLLLAVAWWLLNSASLARRPEMWRWNAIFRDLAHPCPHFLTPWNREVELDTPHFDSLLPALQRSSAGGYRGSGAFSLYLRSRCPQNRVRVCLLQVLRPQGYHLLHLSASTYW